MSFNELCYWSDISWSAKTNLAHRYQVTRSSLLPGKWQSLFIYFTLLLDSHRIWPSSNSAEFGSKSRSEVCINLIAILFPVCEPDNRNLFCVKKSNNELHFIVRQIFQYQSSDSHNRLSIFRLSCPLLNNLKIIVSFIKRF